MGFVSTDSETESCHRICDLPEDLLVEILLYVPTKEAVSTSILSKRWRYVWTMLPILEFKDKESSSKNVGCFIEKSLQLHKAPILITLSVEVGPQCSVDVDVIKLVDKAVTHSVRKIDLKLLWTREPTKFPMSLYTCDTLVYLTLSNEVLVDVSSSASLPSLWYLELLNVVYKDEDSLARLLSSSPKLIELEVERHEHDNLTDFTVKVSSLKTLEYKRTNWRKEKVENYIGSLVIDCPALTELHLDGARRHYFLIENLPCLEQAHIGFVGNPDKKFLRSLSSVRRLCLSLSESMVACYNAIEFSRLVYLYLFPINQVDWLEPLVFFLQNSPQLKTLTIDTTAAKAECLSSSWNQPSTMPRCLSSHLEILRWKDYGGKEDEKQLARYILANSKCLKTMEISLKATCNREESQKELESMPRISASSPLLHFPTSS